VENSENIDAIIYSNNDPLALSTIATIAKQSVDSGRTPIIYDLKAVLYGMPDTYAPSILKIGRKRTPEHIFYSWITQQNYKIRRIDDFKINENDFGLDKQTREQLDDSVFSALLTFTRDHDPNLKKTSVRNAKQKLFIEGVSTFKFLDLEFSNASDEFRVFIPNGRFPHQRMAIEAAKKNNVSTLIFERGEEPETFFLQGYTTQDRIQTQLHASELTAGMSNLEIDNAADRWMQKRSGKNATNEYGTIWDDQDQEIDLGDKPLGIFTSSQDEFLNLGPDYQHHHWADQFEAIEMVINLAYKRGYTPFVRIHPNLTNKSHSFYKKEMNGINRLRASFPDMPIFMHDSKMSTYRLLAKCTCCFVWDSTVGLEASSMGIPVHTLAMSRYGEIADIRQAFSLENLSKSEFEWKVDTAGAKRYMAYLMCRDLEIEFDTRIWKDWDTNSEPISIRISRVLCSGGAHSFTQSFISIFDSYRHRSSSAKINALRKSTTLRNPKTEK
jgi:hypothetical protein